MSYQFIVNMPKSCCLQMIQILRFLVNPARKCKEIDNVKHWLDAKKFCLNVKKTNQMNLKSSKNRSNNDNKYTSLSPYVNISKFQLTSKKKYFVSHLSVLKSRLPKQCGTISKLKHYALRNKHWLL